MSLLAASVVAMRPEPTSAHVPHDHIPDIVVSPAFATDQTVFAISHSTPMRSTDGGKRWVELERGLTGQIASHFAVSPSDTDVVYLSSLTTGVFRSDDHGSTWRLTRPIPGADGVSGIAVSPASADIVIAASARRPGLFRSTDGGASWTGVPSIGKVSTVTFVPDQPGRVVVGTVAGTLSVSDDNGETFKVVRDRGPAIGTVAVGSGESGSTLVAGTADGAVLVSEDTGESWKKRGAGLPEPITSLLLSGAYETDRTVWASTRTAAYRSTDGGQTWKRRVVGLTTDVMADELRLPQFRSLARAEDASGKQVLFLAGFDGLFKSADLGVRWTAIETLSEYVTGLAISPSYASDGTVVVNTYVKGVYVSRDEGESFVETSDGLEQRLNDGNELLPVRRMHNVVFSPDYAADQTIFTATWDRFVRSTNGGRTWQQVFVVAAPPSTRNTRQFVIAVSPDYKADHTVYLGTRQGNLYRSTNRGLQRTWSEFGNFGDGIGVRSLVISHDFANDRTMYAGTTDGVMTSTDAGKTWKALSGPEGITMVAISSNYADDGTVFAGTDRGIFVTRNQGESWALVNAAPLSASSKVTALAVSPDFANDATVLVSVAGVGLFRSTDGGRTFAATGSSLLERNLIIKDFENPTSAPIQFSPAFASDRTVYAYAQGYVVRSTDGGDTWDEVDIPTAAEFVVPPGTETARRAARPRDDDGLAIVPIVIGAALVIAAGAGFVLWRRRRRPVAGDPPLPAQLPEDESAALGR